MYEITKEQKKIVFIQDVRRVLYLAQIFGNHVGQLRINEMCPTTIKSTIKNIDNAVNRLIQDIRLSATQRGTWDAVQNELTKDELNDIGELLISAMGATNIGEIVDIVNSNKQITEPN